MAGGATSALGTVTVLEKAEAVGPLFVDRVSVVGDADYATNGTAGLLAAMKAKRGTSNLNLLSVEDETANSTYYLAYDHAADKLKAFVRATGLEVAAGTDLHGTTFILAILAC